MKTKVIVHATPIFPFADTAARKAFEDRLLKSISLKDAQVIWLQDNDLPQPKVEGEIHVVAGVLP
jgi:hypothetical protein